MKTNFWHLKPCQRGFTLIEVLIAITVFAIGLLGINVMQTSTVKGNSVANRNSLRTNVASHHIETLINIDFNDICSDTSALATTHGCSVTPTCTSLPGSPCAASCTINNCDVANNRATVEHTVQAGTTLTGLAKITTTITDNTGQSTELSFIKSETDI